jgi:S-DNA-T family DNA segregation ATPase FtsK/SpoIIIE
MPTGAMSRLVVVIDEFAALVALDVGLQAIFADLAARGRSLGIHLVVCTQRPAGVVRESVLANVTLRICLRVLEAADSTAVIGRPSAASIPAGARGRGLLADASGARTVQFALAEQPDIEAVAERWSGHPRAEGRPWLDPLPPLISAGELVALFPAAADSSTIGAVDLPHVQRHEPLSVDPWSHGALLVLGGSGSGRTTSLEMLAHAADAEVRRISQDPAELWQALMHPTNGRRVLVVADDVDRMLAWCDPEQRAELCELISRAARDTRRTGVAVAASARSLGGAMHGVQAAFEQRIILRLATREEHLLAGGELHAYRSERRPGSCVWRGAEAQLATPPDGPRPKWRAPIPEVSLIAGRWAIVAARPRDFVARLEAAGLQAVTPGVAAREHQIMVADVDGWLLEHAAVTAARRDGRLLLIGCTASDHRALTRMRTPLPPLSGDDEAWLFDGAGTARVRVRLD